MTHTWTRTTPTVWTVQYVCTCGWTSDTVPQTQGARAGAQLVRHTARNRP